MSNVIRMPFEFTGAAGCLKDASDLEQLTRILVARYGEQSVMNTFSNILSVIEAEQNKEVLEQFVSMSGI